MKRPVWSAVAILTLCTVPSFVLAQSAGFASQPLFLSKEPAVAGEKVRVYTSLTNDSPNNFSGKVVVADENGVIGTIPLSLAAGEARIVSVSWKPSAGTHTVTAKLEKNDNTALAQETAAFNVALPPQPPAPKEQSAASTLSAQASGAGSAGAIGMLLGTSTSIESAAPIENEIASFSPQAGKVTAPVFSGIDAGRSAAADLLQQQIRYVAPKLPGTALGKGSSGSNNEFNLRGFLGSIASVLWTVYFYALVILRFCIAKIVIFYPLLVALFFWLLYKLYRHMSPRRRWR